MKQKDFQAGRSIATKENKNTKYKIIKNGKIEMDIREVMQQKVFAVVGDTLNKEKYACKIKNSLIENGYQTYGVYKELTSLNDVPEEIDIIDLCINPVKGLELMKDCRKKCKCVVIQPGAESDELLQYLKDHNITYLEGCLLVGLSLYKNKR